MVNAVGGPSGPSGSSVSFSSGGPTSGNSAPVSNAPLNGITARSVFLPVSETKAETSGTMG